MPASPQRHRFQLHLSTAIVLMFVSGALMWANLSGTNFQGTQVYGWPFPCVQPQKNLSYASEGVRRSPLRAPGFLTPSSALLFDLLIASAIIFAVYLLSERLIRRRAPKCRARQ